MDIEGGLKKVLCGGLTLIFENGSKRVVCEGGSMRILKVGRRGY